jgi:hypothetical protein
MCVTALLGSQNCTDLSFEPDISQLPSGENATDKTKSLCPVKVDLQRERARDLVLYVSRVEPASDSDLLPNK